MPPDPKGGDGAFLCIPRARSLSGVLSVAFPLYQDIVTKRLTIHIQTKAPSPANTGTRPNACEIVSPRKHFPHRGGFMLHPGNIPRPRFWGFFPYFLRYQRGRPSLSPPPPRETKEGFGGRRERARRSASPGRVPSSPQALTSSRWAPDRSLRMSRRIPLR